MGVLFRLILILHILAILPTVYAAQVTVTGQVIPSKSVNIEFDQIQQFTITLKKPTVYL